MVTANSLPASQDRVFLQVALALAREAEQAGEVPVGAVVVLHGEIIGRGRNQPIQDHDPTAHAEIIAMRQAAKSLGNYRIEGGSLYTTLEPCVMCAGALAWAQLGKLVFAADDEKRGFMRYGKGLLHPKTKVEMGVMMEECSELMSRLS